MENRGGTAGRQKGPSQPLAGELGHEAKRELQFVVTDLRGGSATETRGSFAALVAWRGHQQSRGRGGP